MDGPQDLRIPATDGFGLAATSYAPSTPRGVVVVAGATGVRRAYYGAFASFLAERGWSALTVDYRGIGGSAPARLRGFDATMRDWAEKDLGGAIAWARKTAGDRPVAVVGHSFGGQVVGLAPNADEVDAFVAVAAQSGNWRLWPWPHRYAMAAMWYVTIPILARAFGYFPGRRLVVGHDLPKGVALEWARWGRGPHYIADADGAPLRDGFAAFRAPILAFTIEDDAYAPARAVEELLAFYVAAPRELRRVAPRDVGLRRIGHFGYFRAPCRALWAEAVDWIEASTASR